MKALIGLFIALASMSLCAQPVASGSAPIERALTQLIPAPYTATIDPRIPESTVLRWSASSDWTRALREATRAAGLRVEPNFAAGSISVLPGVPVPASEVKPLAALVPAAIAAAAPAGVAVHVAVPVVALAQASAVAAPTPLVTVPVVPVFVLKPGIRIDTQLAEWAKRDGWSLIWTSTKSWLLPGTSIVSYAGPVDSAVEQAVKDLYGNGIPVRLDIWETNKVMEISHAK